jgi:acetylornithine deacetylase
MNMPTSVDDLLLRLVAFRTVNQHFSGQPGAEPDMAAYLESIATAARLTAQRLPVEGEPSNLLITHEVSPGAPWLLFVSHMDTVDADPAMTEPFVGRIRDGRIYGRGACDTKGSGAAALWSLIQYAARSERPNNIALLFSVEEEYHKAGIRSFLTRDLPSLGWRPAGAVVCEPTELRPVVAHNGLVRWRIRTLGVSAHSSDPSRGASAISMMVKVVQTIESRYIPTIIAGHPLTGKAQCSINLIKGGTVINVIPAECEIHIDRRVVPGEDATQVLPAVERALDDLRRDDPSLRVVQDEPFIDPSLDSTMNRGMTARICRVLEKAGLPSAPEGAKYGTEASNLGQAGIEAVVLGPGSVAQAHTADEWLSLNQLHLACRVYLEIMASV